MLHKAMLALFALVSTARACGAPDAIQTALGRCDMSCAEICEQNNCPVIGAPDCSYSEDPLTGTECPWKCEEDCSGGFAGGPAGPAQDECP